MTVKEYAESINLSVAEILKKCESLGIDVKNANDYLSDDDVINLDFATNLISIIFTCVINKLSKKSKQELSEN